MRRKKSNPVEDVEVEELSKKWHGRDVESDLQVDEVETFDDTVAELAEVEELGILTVGQCEEYNIFFKHNRPKLTSTVDEQLELVGGDQELDGIKDTGKRLRPMGWLVRLVYETDKHHLEGSNGYPESYEHYFAEEYYKDFLDPDDYDTPDEWWEALKSMGVVDKAIAKELIPLLVYDTRDKKLAIVGGDYTVEDVGIKN